MTNAISLMRNDGCDKIWNGSCGNRRVFLLTTLTITRDILYYQLNIIEKHFVWRLNFFLSLPFYQGYASLSVERKGNLLNVFIIMISTLSVIGLMHVLWKSFGEVHNALQNYFAAKNSVCKEFVLTPEYVFSKDVDLILTNTYTIITRHLDEASMSGHVWENIPKLRREIV